MGRNAPEEDGIPGVLLKLQELGWEWAVEGNVFWSQAALCLDPGSVTCVTVGTMAHPEVFPWPAEWESIWGCSEASLVCTFHTHKPWPRSLQAHFCPQGVSR